MKKQTTVSSKGWQLRQQVGAKILTAALVGWLVSSWPAPVLAQDESDEEIAYSRLLFEAVLLPASAITPEQVGAQPAAGVVPVAATPVALAAVPTLTMPSAETPQPNQADIDRYLAQISNTLEEQDLYAEPLREQYMALGQLYQQRGEHDEAIAVFEKAMHIDRVNQGLYTQRQIPLVDSIIASYNAQGNLEELNNYQEYLYYIHQKSFAPDSPELLAAKEKWADWNVQAFLKEGAQNSPNGNPFALRTTMTDLGATEFVAVRDTTTGIVRYVPRNQVQGLLSPSRYNQIGGGTITDFDLRTNAYAAAPQDVVDRRLMLARKLYQEIKQSQNQNDEAARSDSLQLKLASIAFAEKKQFESMDRGSNDIFTSATLSAWDKQPNSWVANGEVNNRKALEAIVLRFEQTPNTPAQELAQAYINLADWLISYERANRAEEVYTKAWNVLQQAGVSQEEISKQFNPAPLIPVPGFALHPYSRAIYGIAPTAALSYKGYMDVVLSVGERGKVNDLKIVAATDNTQQRLRIILLGYLRNQTMRPWLEAGKVVKNKAFNLRIYYNY